MSDDRYLHFTLGPVQGFVSQARRTRDFWAGSFILSWLSAVAMQEVINQNGKILFPAQDDDYLKHLTGEPTSTPLPQQGSVPNRFKASVNSSFDASLIKQAVLQAWKGLSDNVWETDGLEQLANYGNGTRKIWDIQINSFWEMSWCLTNDIADSSILDRRKNWRTHFPPDQPGVKCMMMDGWQELSGATQPHRQGKETLTGFWQQLRNSGASGIKTDLREGEHLCAIGYVKRRFARHFQTKIATISTSPSHPPWAVYGWEVPTGVPSVTYLAAAPWIAQAIRQAEPKKVWQFHNSAYELTKEYGEWDNAIQCVEQALNDSAQSNKRWTALDGNVFFDAALDNHRLWDETRWDKYGQKTKQALSALRKSATLEPISPFYAVLLMDGDSLGKQMSDEKKQTLITNALQRFTQDVPEIVKDNNGFLIYAGGDDVLAILPMEFALACALAVRSHYEHCFKKHTNIHTSISAAIIYSHIKTPLGRVLAESHTVLDDIAKDHHGRDALAVRVLKPGGEHLQWGMPWDLAIDPKENIIAIDKLASKFRKQDKETDFASKFFYRIRQQFELFAVRSSPTHPIQKIEDEETAIDTDTAITLLASDYINSGVNDTQPDKKINMEQARATINELIEQCRHGARTTEADTGKAHAVEQWPRSPLPKPDAALLIRFLANKGIEQ